MDQRLNELVLQRLKSDGSIDKDWSLLVIAACQGGDYLEDLLGERAPSPAREIEQAEAGPALGAYLASITVQGFRGIGPEGVLELTPGPGLTLVVGRNGSGKSSFAEGLEVLFTGDNKRWENRSKVWKEGWRNLHHPDPALVEAELLVEGQGEARATRSWGADAPLEQSTIAVQPKGKPKTDLDYLGWQEALVTYRPFLSYNELSSMLDEGPAKLYDALSSVLGLQDLVEALSTLASARLARKKAMDAAKEEVQELLAGLEDVVEQSSDERARRCREALEGKQWDLDAVETVIETRAHAPADTHMKLLQRASAIEVPSQETATAVVPGLRDAQAGLEEVTGTDAQRAGEIADLLESALEFHDHHGDSDCPVCGNTGALGPSWRERSTEELKRLRAEASSFHEAIGRAKAARSAARELLGPPPEWISTLAEMGIETEELLGHWERWRAGLENYDLGILASHVEDAWDPLLEALEHVRKKASTELQRRQDIWRPVAERLQAWTTQARAAVQGVEQLQGIKAAERWLKSASEDIRNQRFAPVGEKAMEIWGFLRQQSNVQLGKIELTGARTTRRVTLDVTVDGVGGAALGVMSQGELHSLALSLFLPRATLEESPFRFVVIDDPVQSMDPARVDGLARALQDAAKTRQVVVFTHDERLPDSVRRLNIDARIISVTRRSGSIVELREASHPIKAYLDDANALIRTKEMPEQIVRRLVPGLCRLALEATCVEIVRRRRLARGETHAEVEDLLSHVTGLTTLAALALLDDPSRGGDVMAHLNNKFGGRAGDAFKRSNIGSHDVDAGDLQSLARDTESLCTKLVTAS